MVDGTLADWLLDQDPALRWQVERDLLHAGEDVWRATRARVATEGFGARLLALQDADGQWAGGAYFPADFDFNGPEAQDGAGQPWTATTWSLNALRDWGVDASALAGLAGKLAENSRWEYDELPYWGGEVDCCINGYTLANGTWLGADIGGLVMWFADHQLPLNSLNGLLWYDDLTGGSDTTRGMRRRGEDYLLERGLFRRRSTGQPVGAWATEFVYPQRWVYTVLSAADYFLSAAAVDGRAPDPRMGDAIELIRAARQPDGTWLQQGQHAGRVWFDVDVAVGEPSPWLTLFASRVLQWWDTCRHP